MSNLSKTKSLIIIAFIYIFALSVSFAAAYFITSNLTLRLFLMDIFATLIVYIFSVIFKNTSVYDPYWSFVPWVLIIVAMILTRNFTGPIIILLIAFSFWSWRLTINWIKTFKDMSNEDWRYAMYRNNHKRPLFELINLVGLQYMPTLIVFAGLWPFIKLVEQGSNYLSIIGAVVVVTGALLELISDHQVHQFLRETTEKVTCQKGLWNYSRHPNYLGEIMIWFGLAIPHIIQYPTQWYIDIGCILMFLMFNFISIPLMEKRQINRRKDYKNYIKSTSRLFILPKRKIKNDDAELEK